MAMNNISRRACTAALIGLATFAASACAADPEPTTGGAGGETAAAAAPIKVGVVTSTSGLLSAYGKQFTEGFKVGIDYATKGTGEVDGHTLDISYEDDATDPAKATAAVTSLVGSGTKIITGSVSSGVAMQVAPLAEQNKILYISGAAATDALTGINDHTFRAGRQTYQDVVTSASMVGDLKGKKVVVFAQDYEFGQANVKAVQAVLGEAGKGATVVPVLAPVKTSDFTPFVRQVVDAKPDLVFVAWAGDTTNAMWQSLSQQGVFDSTTVVTGLADRKSFDSFGPAATKISFLSHYFAEATDTEANKALTEGLAKEGLTPDIFHNDGFVAAQMVVRAIQEGGDDVAKMITGLEGWTFTGPKGEQTIRAEDHAMLQPMFTAKLTGSAGSLVPVAEKTLSADEVAPPVKSGS